jgi:hypothetical protein
VYLAEQAFHASEILRRDQDDTKRNHTDHRRAHQQCDVASLHPEFPEADHTSDDHSDHAAARVSGDDSVHHADQSEGPYDFAQSALGGEHKRHAQREIDSDINGEVVRILEDALLDTH